MKLEFKDIRKSFDGTEVLHGISFEAQSGQALGLLGRNGAGKTTAIRILMDVFHADSGQILSDGAPFNAKEHRIGYLPEERGLYPKRTVLEQIVFLARIRGMKKADAVESGLRWLERMELSQYKSRKLETLSKGNQQKVQLASTLVHDPEIIVLDEPFSGLDPVNSQVLKDVVKELIADGKLVIFSSHQMGYVEEFCDTIAIINSGEVVLKGGLSEIKRAFGKNRLFISSISDAPDLLEQKAAKIDGITVCGRARGGLILERREDVTVKEIMKAIADSDIDIDKFGSYEPTLTEIFVETAGEDR